MFFIFYLSNKRFLFVLNDVETNTFLQALREVKTTLTTTTEVARTIVFRIFVDDVLRIDALRIVADVRAVVALAFGAIDLEENLSDRRRVLVVEKSVRLEPP